MEEKAKWEKGCRSREHRNGKDVLPSWLWGCLWLVGCHQIGNFLGVESVCLPFQKLVGIRAGFYLQGFIILKIISGLSTTFLPPLWLPSLISSFFFFFNAFLFVCFGWEACRILVPWPRWNRSLQQRKHKAQSQTSPMPHPLSVRSFSHRSHFYFQCSILHLSVENLLT